MQYDLPTILAIVAIIGGAILLFGIVKKLFKFMLIGAVIGIVAFVVFYLLRTFAGV